MSALKDGRVAIELDKTRYLLFDLNAVDAVTDKYGAIDKIGDILNPESNSRYMKDLRFILTTLINEGDDEEELTEKQVGKLVTMGNMVNVMGKLTEAFNIGQSGAATVDEGENPKIAATMNTI